MINLRNLESKITTTTKPKPKSSDPNQNEFNQIHTYFGQPVSISYYVISVAHGMPQESNTDQTKIDELKLMN